MSGSAKATASEVRRSSSTLSAASLVLEDVGDAGVKKKHLNLRQFVAPAIIGVVTLLLLLAPFIFYEGGVGIVKPCRETSEPWRRYALVAYEAALLPLSINSMVLTFWAAGHQFRLVARHVTLVWVNVVLWTSFLVDTCQYSPQERKGLRGIHQVVCLMTTAAVIALLPTVVFERIRILEHHMFQTVCERRLRILLRLTLAAMTAFAVVAVLIVTVGNGLMGPATPFLTELLTISTMTFWLSLLTSYALVLRALAMASYHTRMACSTIKASVSFVDEADMDSDRRLQETMHVMSAARLQLFGTTIQTMTSLGAVLFGALQNNLIRPMTLDGTGIDVNLLSYIILLLDSLANALGTSLSSGACSGSLISNHTLEAMARLTALRRQEAMKQYQQSDDTWHCKVEELAGRGFSLEALLAFYKEIEVYMPHFNSSVHTTNDVVRRAIIPASKENKSSLAEVMMKGVQTRPRKMVTHNWGNNFRNLVAAIIADALAEDEYCKVAYMLDHDIPKLEAWLRKGKCLKATYWVCAFSVSQHDGICGTNPYADRDTLTGELHPVCTCGKPKFFNNTEPTFCGRSIDCEMNKFDDMLAYLAASDEHFSHVIAVDSEFVLFSRAWCVAELAMSYNMGMSQHLLVNSVDCLVKHADSLRHLKVENMKATRPEDVIEILDKIPDKDAFNAQLQHLIFGELLGSWEHLDSSQRIKRVGTIVRWQQEALRYQDLWRQGFRLGRRTTTATSLAEGIGTDERADSDLFTV